MRLQLVAGFALSQVFSVVLADYQFYPRYASNEYGLYERGLESVKAQRNLDALLPRGFDDIYARDSGDLYERDFDDLYERDLEELYQRDIDEVYARENELRTRNLIDFHKRELKRLVLDRRSPTRPSSPAPKSPKSSSGSDSDYSAGSTNSAKLVAMNKVKTSKDKKVRAVGISGCAGIYLFGSGFITATHADPTNIASMVAKAATEAKAAGTVTSITCVVAAKTDYDAAVKELKKSFPNVQPQLQPYDPGSGSSMKEYEFEATQGSTKVVVKKVA